MVIPYGSASYHCDFKAKAIATFVAVAVCRLWQLKKCWQSNSQNLFSRHFAKKAQEVFFVSTQ